jgi:hypothetical protein
MVGKNGNGQFVDEQPYKWSRRWSQEPPVGTEVLVGKWLGRDRRRAWNLADGRGMNALSLVVG